MNDTSFFDNENMEIVLKKIRTYLEEQENIVENLATIFNTLESYYQSDFNKKLNLNNEVIRKSLKNGYNNQWSYYGMIEKNKEDLEQIKMQNIERAEHAAESEFH